MAHDDDLTCEELIGWKGGALVYVIKFRESVYPKRHQSGNHDGGNGDVVGGEGEELASHRSRASTACGLFCRSAQAVLGWESADALRGF